MDPEKRKKEGRQGRRKRKGKGRKEGGKRAGENGDGGIKV